MHAHEHLRLGGRTVFGVAPLALRAFAVIELVGVAALHRLRPRLSLQERVELDRAPARLQHVQRQDRVFVVPTPPPERHVIANQIARVDTRVGNERRPALAARRKAGVVWPRHRDVHVAPAEVLHRAERRGGDALDLAVLVQPVEAADVVIQHPMPPGAAVDAVLPREVASRTRACTAGLTEVVTKLVRRLVAHVQLNDVSSKPHALDGLTVRVDFLRLDHDEVPYPHCGECARRQHVPAASLAYNVQRMIRKDAVTHRPPPPRL